LAPPPLLFAGALALGAGLHALWPRPLARSRAVRRVAGSLLAAVGLGLSAAVVVHFRRAGTPVDPRRTPRRLVVSGPYRFSRNPDYIGQALLSAGLALWLNNAWAVLANVPALVLVQHGVVAREERYLERRFGDEYRRYRDRVPRWLWAAPDQKSARNPSR
nr:isoprenylcysteine carboxylmethyltransferase family protein [Acidobacteriota bacterium]